MKKRIAVITGASGGIGTEFTKLLAKEDIDEIWAIARNSQKLDILKDTFGDKIITIAKDLTKLPELNEIGKMLENEKPVIKYLINNAGMAKMGLYDDFTAEEIDNTVNINCKAPVILSTLCIPYMVKGSRILNICSASAFQPLPFLNLYSASKAFVRNYSRALNCELKGTGITSTAVCPSWVDTELLTKEINGIKVEFTGIVTPEMVAVKAMKDAGRRKDMSVCTVYVKAEHLLAKIFPQKMAMRTWLYKIKKYL